MISGPMAPSGRIRSARPALATAPGMPQTTEVAWSWASTLPPRSTMAREPTAPSEPMPVSTTPSTEAPTAAAALRNSTSTAGRQ